MVDLNEHIKLESAEYEAIAADLQGGIVRAHRRKHADHILMSFTSSTAGRSFIQQVIAGRVTSASDQDADEELKTSFLSFALSAQGFRALKKMLPNSGSAFAVGMRQRSDRLNDPADGWQPSLERRWHAIAILADDDSAKLDAERKLLEEAMDSHDVEFVVERGQTLLDASTEHFGFVDGISQPILVSRTDSDSGAVWDRFFPLKQALVVDRAGSRGSDSLGSYLVFRKLEQNFDEFDAQFAGDSGQKLAATIGRSRAGQPLVPDTVSPGDDNNDFDFRDDPDGERCPLSSHIRKANPRISNLRDTLFVRRGIPYGMERTTGERGLLFLAFNSSLERQFETMQGDWISGNDFPEEAAGTDALLTSGLVTLRGGEYFFMPSISALKNINDTSAPATSTHDEEHTMSNFPEEFDLLGQGKITPDDEFVVNLIDRIQDNRQLYIDAAVNASGKPAVEGNARVLEYLAAVGLDERVIDMGEPNQTYLLDALREMGIRLRRLASAGLAAPEGGDVFGQFLDGILASDANTTW